MADNTTHVEQVDINLEDILGIPGADSVLLAEDKKNSIFSNNKIDTSFIDKPIEKEELDENGKKVEASPSFEEVLNEVLPSEDELTGDNQTTTAAKPGRKKTDKDGTVELVKKLIESGKFIPFEDDKPIEDYTLNDFEELIEANIAEKEKQIKETLPKEFFENLPEELQFAAKYVSDGGTDLKGLFRALSEVEETRELDIENPKDQEKIVREYLLATNFGTPEEIDEEIDSWKDRNELENKASKFKPKLDSMQAKVVQQKLAQQEEAKKMQQAHAQKYMSNVYDALKPGELGGIKLDRKTQEMLYSGLVQPNYPSISGRPTNMLGHLLEKHQYIEPNHALIAEALWLLADPTGYKEKIKQSGEAAATAATVRMLKTEEARKNNGSPIVEKEEVKQRSISRNNNFFKR